MHKGSDYSKTKGFDAGKAASHDAQFAKIDSADTATKRSGGMPSPGMPNHKNPGYGAGAHAPLNTK